MAHIPSLHEACRAAGRPAISVEFFPTKTAEGERALFEKIIPALGQIHPDM